MRQAAIETLRELLICFRDRSDEQTLFETVHRMTDMVLDSVKSSTGAQLGGLLGTRLLTQIFASVIRDPRHYEEICELGLRLSTSKEPMVKQEAFELVAESARLDPIKFSNLYLSRWTNILMEILGKRDRERVMALVAIRNTVEALGVEFAPAGDLVSQSLRQLLLLKGRYRNVGEDNEIMECVAAMARALKESYSISVRALLPALLTGEFNVSLRLALQSIVDNIPGSMPLIEGTR